MKKQDNPIFGPPCPPLDWEQVKKHSKRPLTGKSYWDQAYRVLNSQGGIFSRRQQELVQEAAQVIGGSDK